MSDSMELTLHCLRSIRLRIAPRAGGPSDEVWGLHDEVLANDIEGLDIAIEQLSDLDRLRAEVETLRAERDAERARAELAERERDEARHMATMYQASSDENEEAFRWWKATAEARPDVSREMADALSTAIEQHFRFRNDNDKRLVNDAYVALREHAGKVTR
jgi:hypothetical protein